jgi:hypothetical protein
VTVVRYLIVDSDGKTRTTKNWPALAPGEWVFRLSVTIPDAYGEYAHAGDLDLEVPEPPEATVLEGSLLGGAVTAPCHPQRRVPESLPPGP